LLEQTILSNLLYNEDYCRKVIPYLKDDYFEDFSVRKVFNSFSNYVDQYKEPPSIEALRILLENRKDLNEDLYKKVNETIDQLKIDPKTNQDWLLSETEKFCQEKDLFIAIRKAILILDGKEKDLDKGSIPKLLSDSLGVSFDTHIGHEYLENVDDRYDFYHRVEERVPFDLELFNKITKGGLPRKSLTVLMGSTGTGKTLIMGHIAAAAFMFGKNVLYITAEMAEERIAERIDANLLNVTLDELRELPRETFQKRIDRIKSKTTGRLIIKEYPTSSAHAGHFRHLLNELRLKKNFHVDLVVIDYINICASSRIKGAAAANSYTLVKSIAEELRGLAMEFNIPILSSTQTNRSGTHDTDVDITNVSESFGLAATADAIFALITTEELESMNQIMIKQLKNRWGDLSFYRRFVLGIDRSKMKLYDLEDHAQQNIQSEVTSSKQQQSKGEEKPVFDKTTFGSKFGKKATYVMEDLR
jgi:replicative DNA helicase